MKKILYTSVLACGLLFASSCDDYLDTENYSKTDTSSFPKTQDDAEQIVNSIYSTLSLIYEQTEQTSILVSNVASDEMYGGGSTSNTGAQGIDRLMFKESELFQFPWRFYYRGIFRANYALEAIPLIDESRFTSIDKNYLLGQAYFLRGWLEWEMAHIYETFPVLTATATVNNPRTDVEGVYEQIANDLTQAISLMPAQMGYSEENGKAGRATKYAAEALLGRVWLFYTGFYGKSDMCGISKQQVINYLKDVRDNSKFGLVNDPREIWPWTNEYSSGFAYDTDFGTMAAQQNLHWVGNLCKETIWACHFSNVWYKTGSQGYNRLGEYFGLRNSASAANAACYPYGIGYTNGTVNPLMVEEWATDPDYGYDDIRLWGSVLAVDEAASIYGGGAGGSWMAGQPCELASHPGNDSKEVEKTMFHNKKYIVSTAYSNSSKDQLYNNFFYAMPGFNGSNHNQYDNRNDAIYIRFADVLLMLDELEQTTSGMNLLRARAGLKPYDGYTLERLQKERRYELCFEGVRFDDLRRWYPQDAGQVISKNQVGGFIEYRGKAVDGGYKEIPGNGMDKRYRETRGFWGISKTQITLSEGVLTQTPGWSDDDVKSWLFSNGDLPY